MKPFDDEPGGLPGSRGISPIGAGIRQPLQSPVITFGVVLMAVMAGCSRPRPAATGMRPTKLQAEIIQSGFPDARDSYNCITAASDDHIYYILASEKPDVAGQMYSYDPVDKSVKHVGDLNEASGEKDAQSVAQGRCDVRFVESEGKLYFATRAAFLQTANGTEKPAPPPGSMKPYPGGHLLSYDLKAGKFENLATAPGGEGFIGFTMDSPRRRLYGLTWPSGHFVYFDLRKHELKDLGAVSGPGENGTGPAYRSLCRALALNPIEGAVYFSTADGALRRYNHEKVAIETVETDDLKKDYFGSFDPANQTGMGYNWRQAFWVDRQKAIYALHGTSNYLFRFNPQIGEVEVLGRLVPDPSRRSGMFDQSVTGYAGITTGPLHTSIYALVGGAIYENNRRIRGADPAPGAAPRMTENLHLMTWNIANDRATDQGPIFFANGQRPNHVNSIAVGIGGSIYALSRVSEEAGARTDLIRIPAVVTQ
jgi:hypothetical protein